MIRADTDCSATNSNMVPVVAERCIIVMCTMCLSSRIKGE
ncbi:hypothetical protein TNCT_498241, partial [Trichonephila clavata]